MDIISIVILLVLLCIVSFILSLYIGKKANISDETSSISATVIDYIEITTETGLKEYTPVYHFVDINGHQHVVKARSNVKTQRGGTTGTVVELTYDINNPEDNWELSYILDYYRLESTILKIISALAALVLITTYIIANAR